MNIKYTYLSQTSHNQYSIIYHYYSPIPKLCEFLIFMDEYVINNQYWIWKQIFNSDNFGYSHVMHLYDMYFTNLYSLLVYFIIIHNVIYSL